MAQTQKFHPNLEFAPWANAAPPRLHTDNFDFVLSVQPLNLFWPLRFNSTECIVPQDSGSPCFVHFMPRVTVISRDPKRETETFLEGYVVFSNC